MAAVTTRKKRLNEEQMHAVNRAKTLMIDGEPAENTIIINDKALSELLGCTTATIHNWKKTGVLKSQKRQGVRVTIYRLSDVIKDLEKWI